MIDTRIPVVLRSVEDLAEAKELRSAIALALTRAPIDEDALRVAVWRFVGVERRAGVAPAVVIERLTGLIDEGEMSSSAERRALTHRAILWCVDEYFGTLGEDVMPVDISPEAHIPSAPTRRGEGRSHLRLLSPTRSESPAHYGVVAMLSDMSAEYRGTRLWAVLEESLNDLIGIGDVSINTATECAIGHFCRELVNAKLVASPVSDR